MQSNTKSCDMFGGNQSIISLDCSVVRILAQTVESFGSWTIEAMREASLSGKGGFTNKLLKKTFSWRGQMIHVCRRCLYCQLSNVRSEGRGRCYRPDWNFLASNGNTNRASIALGIPCFSCRCFDRPRAWWAGFCLTLGILSFRIRGMGWLVILYSNVSDQSAHTLSMCGIANIL